MFNSKMNDYKKALKKLKDSPKDRVGILGEVGIVAVGVSAGIGGAGAVAAAAGTTTILGSSTLGGLLGGVLVATTPVGWVVGTAVAGGVVAYGLSRLFQSGNISDERKEQNIRNLKKKIEDLEKEKNKAENIEEKYSKLAEMYLELIEASFIGEDTVKEVLDGIANGTINIDIAFENAINMLSLRV